MFLRSSGRRGRGTAVSTGSGGAGGPGRGGLLRALVAVVVVVFFLGLGTPAAGARGAARGVSSSASRGVPGLVPASHDPGDPLGSRYDGCALAGSGVECPRDGGTSETVDDCFLDPQNPGAPRRRRTSVAADGTVFLEGTVWPFSCGRDWSPVADVHAAWTDEYGDWSFEVVSAPPGGGEADGASWDPQATPDGRYVVFTSDATNLVGAADDNGASDVYLADRTEGTVTLVSRGLDGTAAQGASRDAAVSGDGRWVAFSSVAEDVVAAPAGDNGGVEDVFLFDTLTSSVTLVSATPAAGPADGDSDEPSLAVTPGGVAVAFASRAANLVAGDDGGRDVFVWRDGVGTVRLSEGPGGVTGDGASSQPSLADTGAVAFTSAATNLTGAPDANQEDDVFLAASAAGPVERAVVSHGGVAEPDGASGEAQLSGDGRWLAFTSAAGNLVTPGLDSNLRADAYLRDLGPGGATELASVQEEGGGGSFHLPDANSLVRPHTSAAVSPDGRYVSFLSAYDWGFEPWRRDRTPRELGTDPGFGLLTRQPDGDPFPLSPWGYRTWRPDGADVSADATSVAFRADDTAGAVAEGDTNGLEDWFVRDTTTGENRLVERSATATMKGEGTPATRNLGGGLSTLSPDGSWLRGWYVNDLWQGTTNLWHWLAVERNLVTGVERVVPKGAVDAERPAEAYFRTTYAVLGAVFCTQGATVPPPYWCMSTEWVWPETAYADDASRVLWRSAARYYHSESGYGGPNPPTSLPYAEAEANWGNFGRGYPGHAGSSPLPHYMGLLQGVPAAGGRADVPVEPFVGQPSWKRPDWQASRNFGDAEDVREHVVSPHGTHAAVTVIETLPEGTDWSAWYASGAQAQYRVRVLRVGLPGGTVTEAGPAQVRTRNGAEPVGVENLQVDDDGNVAWIAWTYPNIAGGDVTTRERNVFVNGRKVNLYDSDGVAGAVAPVSVGVPSAYDDVRPERRLVMAPAGGKVAFLGHVGFDPSLSWNWNSRPAPKMYTYDVSGDTGAGEQATADAISRQNVGYRRYEPYDNPAPGLMGMTADGRPLLVAGGVRPLDPDRYVSDTQLYLAGPPDRRPVPMIEVLRDTPLQGRVTLDARDSWDPDGHVVSYAWKVNGFDVPGYPLVPGAVEEFDLSTYVDSGDEYFTVSLTVTDDRGATQTRTVQVPAHENPGGLGDQDVAVEKTGPASFTVGEPGAYTVAVSNVGGAIPAYSVGAGGVWVVDVLPAGVTYEGYSGAGWECWADGRQVWCLYSAALASGGSASPLPLEVAVGPAALPSVTNTATAYNAYDANPANDSSSVTTPVLPGPDVAVVLSAPASFTVGQAGAYSVAVSNVGSGPTRSYDGTGGVWVGDVLPFGLSFTGYSGAGWECFAWGQVWCLYSAALAPGESAPPLSLEVAVGPGAVPSVTNTAATDLGDLNPANDSSSVTTPVLPEGGAPDVAVGVSGPASFTVGVPGTYQVAVTNIGGGATTAETVVVDVLPTGLTFEDYSGENWACVALGQAVTCMHADVLDAGVSAATLTLDVAVDAGAVPSVTSTVSASSAGDVNPANDSSSVTTPVADLGVGVSGPALFTVGQPGAYSVVVSNVGGGATQGYAEGVDGVWIGDVLPAGVTFTGYSGAGWSCEDYVVVLWCVYSASLAPGESAPPLTLDVAVGPGALPEVVNTVEVYPSWATVLANDSASVTTPVSAGGAPDVAVGVSGPASFTVGVPGTYEVSVSNGGDAATTGPVEVVDVLPAGLVFGGFSGAGWACGALGQVVTCTHAGSLAPGESAAALTLDVAVDAGALPEVVNTVSASTPGDSEPANDSASMTTPVSARGEPGDADGDTIPDPFDPDGGTVAYNRTLVRVVTEGPLTHLSLLNEAGEKAWMPRRAHPGIVRVAPGLYRGGIVFARVGDYPLVDVQAYFLHVWVTRAVASSPHHAYVEGIGFCLRRNPQAWLFGWDFGFCRYVALAEDDPAGGGGERVKVQAGPAGAVPWVDYDGRTVAELSDDVVVEVEQE